ncbi:antitoxin Xre/MbcA/ParS toxin-binding domain-containing protein [Flavobacterium sp.]|uniref:antitoxin Xre/MbcA/ParS toxin-binding domain-containing protein n=1 Tax=Flavobacterium sp. TaxID=239 RepID=UPI002628A3D2|nr:antitoxin Xre/MbcA/ParS toxin-binding domain-containing protein [Flavobacterium sp.]
MEERLKDSGLEVHEPAAVYNYMQTRLPDFNFMERLYNLVSLTEDTLAYWLSITPKTIRTYRKNRDLKLKANTKEQIVMLLLLYKHGEELFGDVKTFESWLAAPNISLGGVAPQQFLNTVNGIRLIDNKLTALAFGENA